MRKQLLKALLVAALIGILFSALSASAQAQTLDTPNGANCTCAGTECNFEASYYGFEAFQVVEIDWGDGCITLSQSDGDGRGSASHFYERGLWILRIGPLQYQIVIGGVYLPMIFR